QGLGLVGERLAGRVQPPGSWLVRAGLVAVGEAVFPQVLDDGPVATGLGAVGVGARVEPAAGQGGEALGGGAARQEGAAGEGQADRWVIHEGDYRVSPSFKLPGWAAGPGCAATWMPVSAPAGRTATTVPSSWGSGGAVRSLPPTPRRRSIST